MKVSNPVPLWVVVPWLAWLVAGGSALAAGSAASAASEPAEVEYFEKKVRPLLVARCYKCHAVQQPKGSLRLDSRAGMLTGGDTGPAIVPGKPEESLLVDAIRYGDTYQMPPKSQLPAEEVATLVEWVRRGAAWGHETPATTTEQGSATDAFDLAERARHWSFQPIADVAPPEGGDASWIKTPVDRFILARLEEAGSRPAPPADKRTLLRRLTYDLTGLPPTPEAIQNFLADDAPRAYERTVDRLLASPHYGERWARHWLDLVRYAETFGHEFDFNVPNAFRYRDYLIRALNDDVPFDQFVIEHVAGDLLPEPRRDPETGHNESIIATGCFLFGEAKHSPVDVRQDEADRIDNQIDVFAKTFLGLTVSCARCHDHKFDAISTKDYYALAGYLQSSRYQQAFIDPPETLAESIDALTEIRGKRQTAIVEFARAALAPRLERMAATLQEGPHGGETVAWTKYLHETARAQRDDPLHAWSVLTQPQDNDAPTDFSERRARLAEEWNARPQPDAADPTTAPTLFADFSGPDYGSWTATGPAFGTRPAAALDGSFVAPAGRFAGRLLAASAAHSGLASIKLRGVLRSPTFEITTSKIFYRLYGSGGNVRLILDGLQLIQNPIYGGLVVGPGDATPHWHAQDVSKWLGHRAYIEVLDDDDGYIALEKVAFGNGPAPDRAPNRLVAAMIDDSSIQSAAQLADAYQALLVSVLGQWLDDPRGEQPDREARAAIINWIVEGPWLDDPTLRPALAAVQLRLAELADQQQKRESRIAAPRLALALADGTAENERVFIRGNHKTPGDEVPRRFLEALGGTRFAPPELGSGRLELARQLVSPDNPLVARVVVNRLWHHHFGSGIVRTVDNFGVMGQPPTHPELLDYLAAELMREGWSLKHMHRLMVLSSTYRMSSRPQPEADSADPLNALCHRMPVRRLEAESIRDAILAVSGRLDRAMYGPGVMPYLTPYMTGRGRPTDSGPLDGGGRRSVYLAVRRNFISPMFLAFDYPTPFTTIGGRGVSNVPAQALTMMNNPFVVEQARVWAQRVLDEPERAAADRVADMYLTALGRTPDEAELQAALTFVEGTPETSAPESSAALGEGGPAESSVQTERPASELQTWSDFAHVLLNLKEFIFIP